MEDFTTNNTEPGKEIGVQEVRQHLDLFETKIADLKMRYDQHFLGIVQLPPEKAHAELKLMIRRLRKLPFKNSMASYRLRSLELRYSQLNSYWMRVLKEKEDGTYVRDVFKANMRERVALEEAYAQTSGGKAERTLGGLFESYRNALEKASGNKVALDYDSFESNLLKRARELKDQHGADKKVSFKVVLKEGKVSLQAKVQG